MNYLLRRFILLKYRTKSRFSHKSITTRIVSVGFLFAPWVCGGILGRLIGIDGIGERINLSGARSGLFFADAFFVSRIGGFQVLLCKSGNTGRPIIRFAKGFSIK